MKKLLINYEFLKELILQNQNIFNQSSSIISKDKMKLAILANRMRLSSVEEIEIRINKTLRENISILTQIFGI